MTVEVHTALGGHPDRSGAVFGRAESAADQGAGHTHRMVLTLTARTTLRSGLLWGLVFGAYIVIQALSYASTYTTQPSRDALARSFSSSSGLNALVGPAHQLGTVMGYTTWKSLGALTAFGAVWAILLSSRLMRGEEDAGRWEILLAGQTTRARAAAQAGIGLGAGFVALFGVVALTTIALGHSSQVHYSASSAVFFAMAITSGAAIFLAVGMLTSQLASTRRQAAAYGAFVLGVCFAVRMVADTSPSVGWMNWATPLGWVDELQPFTNPQPFVLVAIWGLIGALAVSAVMLAARRDLGASILPDGSHGPAHTLLLFGPVGLALRTIRPAILGWFVGIGAFGLLLGSVAKQAAKSIEASPSARAALSRLGGTGGEVKAYLGISFLIFTLFVTLIACGQITTMRHEESGGLVEHLLVRPVSRLRWMVDRLGVALGVVVLGGLLAGVFTWLGLVSQGIAVGLATMVGAGLNTVPAAICVLGIGALAFGVAPRMGGRSRLRRAGLEFSHRIIGWRGALEPLVTRYLDLFPCQPCSRRGAQLDLGGDLGSGGADRCRRWSGRILRVGSHRCVGPVAARFPTGAGT